MDRNDVHIRVIDLRIGMGVVGRDVSAATPGIHQLNQPRARNQRPRPSIVRQSRRVFRPRLCGPVADRIRTCPVHAASA